MLISKYSKESLNSVALHRIIHGLEGSGMTLQGKCPKCGAKGKKKSKWQGLWVKDDEVRNKHMCGCNSCGFIAGGGAINVAMSLYDLEFVPACELISKETGIQIEYEQPKKKNDRSERTIKGSFCARQLEMSGLTPEDVMVDAVDGDESYKICPFRPGSLDIVSGAVDEMGDEMLLLYYDLEGRRRKCIPSKFKSREVPYTRIRWSMPEAKKDKYGKPVKYQTIFGSKTELWITQTVRSLYKSRQELPTIFIQEGEKKAEKASKHGLPSIAIQGITNIGRQDEGLPAELQYLVQRCRIKNLVFLMDADWNDLNRSLQDDDAVDQRPWNFARAVIKFKKFVQTLALSGIYVDIWFAHVNANPAGDKGIDDLLCNTLKGKEDTLRQSVDASMIAHDGKGEYIDIINITSWSDSKIQSLWALNNADDFFEIHKDRLSSLRKFKFSNVFYRNEGGKINIDSEFGSGKEFWTSSTDDKGKTKIDIDHLLLRDFLISNGFRTLKQEESKHKFVKIESGIIKIYDEFDIRRFVIDFVCKASKSHAVKCHFLDNIANKLSYANLCQLEMLKVPSGKHDQYSQRFYFSDSEAIVTSKNIEVSALVGPVWEDNLIKRSFERIPIFSRFEPDGNGSFIIAQTDAGYECEFLRFLMNTSNSFRSDRPTPAQLSEYQHNIANKITAIGYLLRSCKTPSEKKAVVAMDAKMSEVGVSSGRTGKSFVGVAISKFISQAVIDGRNLTNDDQYMLSEVTNTTENIIIDDINIKFDFGRLYQSITGKLSVNVKQGSRFTIPFEDAPKFYITTNHALQNLDDSANARIIFMSFSDWYSSEYTPFTEFGHYLFDGWDDRQWLLFDNLMLECVMLYMRSLENSWAGPGQGAVLPPMENLRRREYRQEMGEMFLSWADIYFSPEAGHLGSRTPRKEMYESFLSEYGQRSTQISARSFRDKIHAYCKYASLHFNPAKRNSEGLSFDEFSNKYPGKSFFGERDVSGPTEYFTISLTGKTNNLFT